MTFICGVGCNDWMIETSVEERIETVLKEARDGVIYLLHDMLRNMNTVDINTPERKLYSVVEKKALEVVC